MDILLSLGKRFWYIGTTLVIALFSIAIIIFHDWTTPVEPVFITQAVDCTQGFLCDRDNVCDGPCENSVTCPVDCHACGNNVCEPTENNANCPSDCPNPSNCGNRYCESGETYQSCASDCALCERRSQEFNYVEGCSAYNIQNGYNIDLGAICACGSNCPIGMTGNFSCPYAGFFYQTEDGSCDNGIDDDNDGIVDCNDSDCYGDSVCCSDTIQNGDETDVDCGGSCPLQCGGGGGGGGGGLSSYIVRDSDDTNSPTSTLADALGSADYLVVGFVETLCGPCQTFGANLNANNSLQQIFNQGTCNFITVTDPSVYNGIFSTRLSVVGASSYVGSRSKELVSRDAFISAYSIQGSPQALLINAQGELISQNIIQNNNANGVTFSQDFYSACDSGGGNNGGSGSDNNGDGIPDSEQTDYVQTITSNNGSSTTLTATGNNIVITNLSLSSNNLPSGSWYPAGGIDFSLTLSAGQSAAISLLFTNIAWQADFLVYKQNGSIRETINNAIIQQQGNDILVTYTLTDNGTLDINPSSGVIDDPIALGCSDPDSNQLCGIQTSTEICTGGVDEDLDGSIDCVDSDCSTDVACAGGGGGGTGSAEICTGGVDEDLDTLIDCADSDCSTDVACAGGGGGGTGSAEICTGGVDEDLDTFIDCADSSCFGNSGCCSNGVLDGNETGIDCGGSCSSVCAGSGTNLCQDTVLNGTETDVDCGGLCPSCTTGKHCTVDADCASSTCVYGVVGTRSVVAGSRELQGGLPQIALPVVTTSYVSDPERERYENRLLIKFKQENNLLLPTYEEDMLLNSKERYLGYLIGKVTSLYEQQGIAPLMMVRAVDQLFDFDIASITHVYDFDSLPTEKDELAQIYRVTFDENTDLDALVAQLQRNIAVEFIEKEPLYKLTYTDPESIKQRHLPKIEADKARFAGASGNASVVIAVIDNGFDLTHPDLVGALVPGRDVADNDSNPTLPASWLTNQYGSHGTHTIGIAGAVTDNALGIASVAGGVRIMPIKATSDVYDPVYVTHAYQALQYAVSRPEIDIISMSFGGPPSSTLESLINAHPEKIFVAAAGNDNVNTAQYPAAYAAVVSVAATNSFDDKAVFSNYGSWIDISAPGVSILSTVPTNSYAFHDGTSMATPLVASTLGLLLSLGATDPVLTMKQTADAMPSSTYFINNLLGVGRVNVCKAVNALGIPCISSSGGGSSTGGTSTGGSTSGGSSTGTPGKGMCLLLGSPGTGGSSTGQTGTGSTGGSTTGQTGTGTSTGQKYPVGSIQITANDTTVVNGDTILWTMSRSYTTYGTGFPAATVDLYVDLPYGLTYINGSYSLAGDGTFLGYDEDQGDIVFVMEIAGLPSSSTSNSKTYEGTVRFRTNVAITSSITTNVVSSMLCYDLDSLTYVGSASCSTSSNRQSGIDMNSDSQKITINQSTNNGTTTSSSTSAGTTTNGSTTAGTTNGSLLICGNGVTQVGEQCDDGNLVGGDGCSASCSIESGRRCIATSPSQCGTDDCFTHGKAFPETNIFGTCCGGLSEIVVSPTSALITGVVKSHICYDPYIGQPVCDTKGVPSGRRVPTSSASGHVLVLKDSCRAIYKDYYKELLNQLQGARTQCIFADIPYDQVVFKDIKSTKQKVSIQTLRDACIVQGVNQNLDSFGPNLPVQRAELIKMVVKLLILSEGVEYDQSSSVYSGGIQFMDVPPTFWGARYIDEAVRRGLLFAWSEQGLMTFFKPFASVTREEFIALMRRIPGGQFFSREELESMMGKRAVVTRSMAAEVLVKKFLVALQPFFYYKGDQEEYYRKLAEELRGKNYQQQYAIILSQIDKLTEEEEHGSPEKWSTTLDPYRMQQYLRHIVY